jgi:hypothetical protein
MTGVTEFAPRLPSATELEHLLEKARVEYASLSQSIVQGTRTMQGVAMLASLAILVTIAQLRDRLTSITLGEFPTVALTPVLFLICALLISRRINTQTKAYCVARLRTLGADLRTPEALGRLNALLVQTMAAFDAFVCHKATLLEPTGLLSQHRAAFALCVATWRARAASTGLARLLRDVNFGALLDERRLRIAIDALARRFGAARPMSTMHRLTAVVIRVTTPPTPRLIPASIHLLC